MKDLIAKLQLDANCALGAIWLHIDAQAARIAELEEQQAFGIGETYANALSRIAELEAQIAAASAPADTDKLREIADFIESGIQYNQDAPDMMPEPASKWDYEAGLLVYELRSTALQAPVREVPEGPRKVVEQMHHALSVAEGYMDAVCFNTTNPKKRNNYAGGLRIIRDAMSAYEALSLPAAPVQQEGE